MIRRCEYCADAPIVGGVDPLCPRCRAWHADQWRPFARLLNDLRELHGVYRVGVRAGEKPATGLAVIRHQDHAYIIAQLALPHEALGWVNGGQMPPDANGPWGAIAFDADDNEMWRDLVIMAPMDRRQLIAYCQGFLDGARERR